MSGWLSILMPRENRFWDLFRRHAETLIAGSAALSAMIGGTLPREEAHAELQKREEEADAIAREVRLAVRRTFITPIDRSDIQSLISSLDDAIDQMLKTSKTVCLFDFNEFGPNMRGLAEIIVQASGLVVEAVGLLPEMRRNRARINAIAEEVVRLEERSDELYDEGRRTLFERHRSGEAMPFLVGREVFDHLEKVVDRLEDVANEISGVLIENV